MKAPFPWKAIAKTTLRAGLHGTGWLLSSAGGLLQIGGNQLHALALCLAATHPK